MSWLLIFSSPFFHEVVHIGELLFYLVGIGGGFVDFVDCEDHGHACSRGMVDGLDRLRHDIVVGGDDDDCKVGHFRSTGTHGGEGLVAGGVEEGDSPSVGELDVVGSDMLGDAACLSRYDVGFTDIVEQRGLAMVDVAALRSRSADAG